MADLFPRSPGLDQQIECVSREIGMQAVLTTLQSIKPKETPQ